MLSQVITNSLLTIITTCLIIILLDVKKLLKLYYVSPDALPDAPPTPDVLPQNAEYLTSYELERLEREDEFDKRINMMKEEINVQKEIIRRGVIAEELHPMVHNLPHDGIETRHDLPSYQEVAE